MLLKTLASASLIASALAAPAPAAIEERGTATTFFPWLLVPIKQAQPNTAFGTQYTVDVSYDPKQANRVDTLVTFTNTVPLKTGQKCSLQFNLDPSGKSNWSVTGSDKFEIVELGGAVDQSNTWNKCPSYGRTIGTVSISPKGGAGTVNAPIVCKQGRVDYALRKSGNGALNIHWFEEKNPLLGLTYVVQ